MEQFINNLIENKISDMHTTMLAEVKKVNKDSADIKILYYKESVEGEVTEYPILKGVPVISLSATTTNTQIKMPLHRGDKGLLFIAERDISNFLEERNKIDSTRKFDISDAFFLQTNFLKRSQDLERKNIIIENEKSKFELTPSGQIKIEGLTDLLQELSDLINVFIKNQGNFGLVTDPQSGAQIPVIISQIIPQFVKIKAKIDAMNK